MSEDHARGWCWHWFRHPSLHGLSPGRELPSWLLFSGALCCK